MKNNKNFGVFNSLFRYAPQRIEHSKKHPQKVGNYFCEKLGIYNCEKLGIVNLLFTPGYLATKSIKVLYLASLERYGSGSGKTSSGLALIPTTPIGGAAAGWEDGQLLKVLS